MHQSIALQAVTIYRPETQTNKLKLIFNKSLTFVWLLSLKWEKWQNWDKNCKSVAVNSDVIRALRYWHSNPPPPTPGTWRGIKHWPGVKIPLIFPLPGPRRLLKAPYSRALVVLGEIWLSRDRTPNERRSVRTTGIAMFTLALSS